MELIRLDPAADPAPKPKPPAADVAIYDTRMRMARISKAQNGILTVSPSLPNLPGSLGGSACGTGSLGGGGP